jgi:cell division protein FtsI/penicillin-binding protein 2
MTKSLQTEVHNKILTILQASAGIPVVYDPSTGEALALVDEEPYQPHVSEVGANNSGYSASENRRSGIPRERTSWEWAARVAFHGSVDYTAFENTISQYNSYPKNETDGIQGFIIELESMTVTDPPHQDDDGGTVLDLIFNVSTTRL